MTSHIENATNEIIKYIRNVLVSLLNLQVKVEVYLDIIFIELVRIFEAHLVFIEPVPNLLGLWSKNMAFDLYVVLIKGLRSPLGSKPPVSTILVITTSSIELHAYFVLRQRLVLSDQRRDVVLLERLEQARGALADLEHRPLAAIVWLHSGEVPSTELLEVDGSIVVEVQINECFIELLLIELAA